MDYDVIVVGAGPGGSSTAKACAEQGLKVALLEKHKQLGMKVCAGGLDHRIIHDFDIDDSAIQRDIQQYCFYTPSGRRVMQRVKSATVNRSEFDRYLVERAVDAGATLFTFTTCQEVVKNGSTIIGVTAKASEGQKKFMGKVVVAADGFNSVTARSAGLLPPYDSSDVGITLQRDVCVDHSIEDDTKHIFYGKAVSPCGFGWIYPKKHCYTVGLGALTSHVEKGRLNRNLEYLINEHPRATEILGKITRQSSLQGACLPLRLSSVFYGDGIVAVGDAAGQVSPLGGNGIYYAMKAGVLASKVIADAITEEDVSENKLKEYQETFFSQYGNELRRQKRILEMVEGHFDLYMEARLFLDGHKTLKRTYDSGRASNLFKRL